MARPPKDPADRATEELTVRFTEEERRNLDWLTVELRSRSAGDTVRRAVRELFDKMKGKR
jgi:hypothetical protein